MKVCGILGGQYGASVLEIKVTDVGKESVMT